MIVGEVSEWLKVALSKSVVGKPTEGSNPSLSAKIRGRVRRTSSGFGGTWFTPMSENRVPFNVRSKHHEESRQDIHFDYRESADCGTYDSCPKGQSGQLS